MVSSILTIILIVLLVVIGLFAIPISLTHQLSWKNGFQGEFTLRWLFGLVRIHFSPSRPGKEETGELIQLSSKTKKASGKKKPSTGKKRNIFVALRQKAFRQRILRFITDLWRAVHKENVRLRVCLGLGDPADTGRLWAIMGPIAGILSTAKEAKVEIVPDFLESNIEVDSSGTVRLIPLQIIGLILGLLLSPTILKGIKQMRSA
jgi:hypothetical protein